MNNFNTFVNGITSLSLADPDPPMKIVFPTYNLFQP